MGVKLISFVLLVAFTRGSIFLQDNALRGDFQIIITMNKKYFSRKAIFAYLSNSLSGSLLGFLVGMWATKLVSGFFETRNIYNLFGLKAKKALISKAAFENMEWVISIIIGFFVFEIFDKIVKEKLNQAVPVYYQKIKGYLREKGWLDKAEAIRSVASVEFKERSDQSKEKVKNLYNKYFGA